MTMADEKTARYVAYIDSFNHCLAKKSVGDLP